MKRVLEKGTRSVRGCNERKQVGTNGNDEREIHTAAWRTHKVTITLGKKRVA
jgi:hypothetical protein